MFEKAIEQLKKMGQQMKETPRTYINIPALFLFLWGILMLFDQGHQFTFDMSYSINWIRLIALFVLCYLTEMEYEQGNHI